MSNEISNNPQNPAEVNLTDAKIQEIDLSSNEQSVNSESKSDDSITVEQATSESNAPEASTIEPGAENKINSAEVEENTAKLNAETVEEKVEEVSTLKSEATSDAELEKKIDETISEAKTESVVETPVVNFDEVLKELQELKEANKTLEITIDEKVRGGFRTKYKDCPLFLPVSHFSMERNPSEKVLDEAVGKTIEVQIFDIKNETKTVILSRKALIESKVWDNINVGDKVEGIVSSTPNFGIFLDLGGVEGLIHISRLSKAHINNPNQIAKKGDKLEAMVIEVNKEKNRIALSRQELEPNPWEGIDEEFPLNTIQKGVVRKITNFGAYVEVKPGVDGLLRTGEMSWTKRISDLNEVLKVGQNIEVFVSGINIDKQNLTLSVKRLSDNPWTELEASLPIGSIQNAQVSMINDKGVILTLDNKIDGFMPKSKLRPIMDGNTVPYDLGQTVEVTISEIIPDQESLILTPVIEQDVMDSYKKSQENRKNRGKGRERSGRGGGRNEPRPTNIPKAENNNFALGDLLNQAALEKLSNIK